MPFYTISTSIKMNNIQKREVVYKVTELTIKELNVPPDKIQVILQTIERDCIGRAGVTLDNDKFSEDSRLVQLEPKKSYYDDLPRNEDMISVELDIWDSFNIEQKEILSQKINKFFVDKFNLSGDNILIIIRDVSPNNWVQNGILGGRTDFLQESRKYK